MPLTTHLESSFAWAGKCLVPNLVTEPGQTTCLVPPRCLLEPADILDCDAPEGT